MAIIKKEYVDNSIFKELLEKYPPTENENGVCYKQELDYLTFETDFITNPIIRGLQQQYGGAVIAVIFYLRTEMCKNGWKVRCDTGMFYNTLLADCSHFCNLDIEKTDKVIRELVANHILYSVQDKEIEAGFWLTCPQQIYNYEMACNNRMLARERQAKARAKRRAETASTQEQEQEQIQQEEQGQTQETVTNEEVTSNIEQQQEIEEENLFGLPKGQ